MLCEYGGAEWADEQARGQLTVHWLRRKRFEARLIASEVGKLFGGENAGNERVSGAELLGMAGITLEG
mgnify:CR=1 FL=1